MVRSWSSSLHRSRSFPRPSSPCSARTAMHTVTDVGSTKASVVEAADSSPRFVGGHPICGSESRGPENASAGLFEGATWFLTPTAHTDPGRHRLVHGFVSDLGATPVAIDAAAHDRLVALTSHVPHVLANVVANQTGATRVEGHEPLAHAGGSLRDMTRIAGANPRIWVDIFLDNAAAIREALAEHRRRIEQVEAALEQGDAGFLARWIGEARGNRRRMLEREYPDAGALQRVRVHVPDRPGVLAGITQALGAERINIEDFELHHVSPERGGTLTLLVDGRGRGAARRRAARGAGLRRRRLARCVDEGRAGRVARRATSPSPGDKSISHRALLLGAICRRRDADRRLRPLRRHRVDARRRARARRRGRRGRRRRSSCTASACAGCARREPIDCGNAGHARAAARRASSRARTATFELTGDESLSSRPMERIAEPLARMGAHVETTDGHLPLDDRRARRCTAIDYELPVASAQVKSAMLLAGLGAEGRTTVVEPAPTRDHTELMLQSGRRARRDPRRESVSVEPAERLHARRGRRSRRLLLRGAVHRRGDAAARVADHDPRREPEPAPHRPARRARADGRARRRPQRAAGRRRAGRRPRGALRRADRDDDRRARGAARWSTSCRSSRCSARARAGRPGLRRRGAARKGDRPDRDASSTRCARSACASSAQRRRLRGPRRPARPRGGTIDAAGDHRIAMLGAIAGLVSREGVRSRAPSASL